MNIKKTKQLILDSLRNEESCFKDLIEKIREQKKAIENKDEVRVLEIIEEKNTIIEIFHFHEGEVNTRQQSLPLEEIQSLGQEGEVLKKSLETLLETIIRMEEECETEIGLKMKEVEKRIFGLQKGKKIGQRYGGFLKNRPIISRKV